MTFRQLSSACALLAAMVLAACQGNVGSGGLAIPQAPQYNAAQGPSGTTTASRQHALDGAVTLSPELNEIPLPNVDGFSVAIELGTPPPAASPSPATSGSPAPKRSSSAHAALAPDAVEAATLAPSTTPAPVASSSPSPGPSSSAAGAARPSPAASPSPSGAARAATKIITKTIAYPDDAPAAPTPAASGNVQTFTKRTAIVRGYVEAGSVLSLYGLSAIRFTITADEVKPGRGFTVAVFEAAHKHHETLVVSDANAAVANNVVTASGNDAIVLKKNTGYLFMLYGDELAPTPGPAYPSAGINPFVTPAPGGIPQGPGLQTPLPGQQTPFPGQQALTPTPIQL